MIVSLGSISSLFSFFFCLVRRVVLPLDLALIFPQVQYLFLSQTGMLQCFCLIKNISFSNMYNDVRLLNGNLLEGRVPEQLYSVGVHGGAIEYVTLIFCLCSICFCIMLCSD